MVTDLQKVLKIFFKIKKLVDHMKYFGVVSKAYLLQIHLLVGLVVVSI
jgi:hypothetical protein